MHARTHTHTHTHTCVSAQKMESEGITETKINFKVLKPTYYVTTTHNNKEDRGSISP